MLRLSSGSSVRRAARSVVPTATTMARSSMPPVTAPRTLGTAVFKRSVASLDKASPFGHKRCQDRVRKFATMAFIGAIAASVGVAIAKSEAKAATTDAPTTSATRATRAATVILRAKCDGKVVWRDGCLILKQYLPSKDEVTPLLLSTSSTLKVGLPFKFKDELVYDEKLLAVLYEVDENGVILQTIPLYHNLSVVPESVANKKYQKWRYRETFIVNGSDFEEGRLIGSVVVEPNDW